MRTSPYLRSKTVENTSDTPEAVAGGAGRAGRTGAALAIGEGHEAKESESAGEFLSYAASSAYCRSTNTDEKEILRSTYSVSQ